MKFITLYILLFFLLTFSGKCQVNKISRYDISIDTIFQTTDQLDFNYPVYQIKNKPDGLWMIYLDSTQNIPMFYVEYAGGEAVEYRRWENDVLVYFLSKQNGELSWYNNGVLRSSVFCDCKRCTYTFYYQNGLPKKRITFLVINDETVVDKVIEWDSNGNPTKNLVE